MDINKIRKYFTDQYKKTGLDSDRYRLTAVPKHIRYLLTKQVISLKPSEEMITSVFEEVLKLYFEAIPWIVSAAYTFDESRRSFEEAIKRTIKQFWPRKHIPISDEYHRIYDIVEKIAEPMTIYKKQFYLEQLPHYIEGRTYCFEIIEVMFEDHLPPVCHMWEIEHIIRESLEKLKS